MDDLHRENSERPSVVGTSSYSIEAAIEDAIQRLTDDPAPHDSASIHYWIWTGTRLVRASPETDRRLREREQLEQEELRLLSLRQRALRQERWYACVQLCKRLSMPVRRLVERSSLWGARKAAR
jgi:hypothetical protein